jgi:Type II secretion system (T2SS), protein G
MVKYFTGKEPEPLLRRPGSLCDRLTAALILATALATFTGVFIVFGRVRSHCPCGHHDTRGRMKRLERALVAYRNEHFDDCPPSLASFVERRFLPAPVDTWNQPLVFVCPGVHDPAGADLTSAGADHIFGTADDLHSWDP